MGRSGEKREQGAGLLKLYESALVEKSKVSRVLEGPVEIVGGHNNGHSLPHFLMQQKLGDPGNSLARVRLIQEEDFRRASHSQAECSQFRVFFVLVPKVQNQLKEGVISVVVVETLKPVEPLR